MSRRWPALSEQQVSVLRWIADGCAPGVMVGSTYKHTARALRDRGLAALDKRGGGWSAAVTVDGQYYLDHGAYKPRPPVKAVAASTPRAGRRQASPEPSASVHAVDTAELFARIQAAAQRRLVLPNLTEERRAGYVRALTKIRTEGMVPSGFELRHTGRSKGPLVIVLRPLAADSDDAATGEQSRSLWTDNELEQASTWLRSIRDSGGVLLPTDGMDLAPHHAMEAVVLTAGLLDAGERILFNRPAYGADHELGTALSITKSYAGLVPIVSVQVPDAVHRYHPSVRWFRQQPDRHELTKELLPRASLLLEAIAREAARRGWSLEPREFTDPKASMQAGYFPGGQFEVQLGKFRYYLRIREVPGSAGDRYEPKWPDPRPRWQQKRYTLFVPTGRLMIETAAGSYRDDSRLRLESRLPTMLAALEAKRLTDEHSAGLVRRLAELRGVARALLADRRRVEREAAREEAQRQAVEVHRAEVLMEQIEKWERAQRIDAYLAALAAVSEQAGIEPAWVAWIRAYRDRLDPAFSGAAMPPDAILAADDLNSSERNFDPSFANISPRR